MEKARRFATQTAEAAAKTKIVELEQALAAADGAKEQAVAAALAEASSDSEKAAAAKRVKALEDALAAAGDLFQNEKREALEDLTQKHESVLAETERKVGKARGTRRVVRRPWRRPKRSTPRPWTTRPSHRRRPSRQHCQRRRRSIRRKVNRRWPRPCLRRMTTRRRAGGADATLQAAQTKALEEQADSLTRGARGFWLVKWKRGA